MGFELKKWTILKSASLYDALPVKKPTSSTEILDDDQKLMWTNKQGCLEQQLALAANCGSVSEPDIPGM